MIQNFDELKKQLAELSSVINSFKSEAVQLKIVELIFRGTAPEDSAEDEGSANPPARKQRAKSKKKATTKKASKKTASKKSSKIGPASILTELIDEGFFDKAKTIGDIISHSDSKKARKFKANELSSPLARFVRDGRLKRDKNKYGQYEYTKG